MGDILEVARKGGELSYKVRIRIKGQRLLTKTFKRKTDAKKWLQLVEGKLVEGKGLPRVYRHTVDEAIERYLNEIIPQKKPTTQTIQKQKLQHWRERIGHYQLIDVDSDVLEREKAFLLETPVERQGQKPTRRGPAAVNRYFDLLRHVFNVSLRRWKWCSSNPVVGLSIREPKGRTCILSDHQLKSILEGLEKHEREDFRLIVMIALVTGCRRGNAQSLKWENVDYQQCTITFPDTKNNQPLTIPITKDLRDLLKTRRDRITHDSPYAFPSKQGSDLPYVDIKKQWQKFARELDFTDLHFHDLRHAVASYLAKNSVPLLTIGRMLGHKSLESTKRYAHLAVNDIIPQTEMLGERLRRVK